MSALLEFDGEPFDPLAGSDPTSTPTATPAPVPPRTPVPSIGGAHEPAATLARLRAGVVAAHASALDAHAALQRRLLAGITPPVGPAAVPGAGAATGTATPLPAPAPALAPGLPALPPAPTVEAAFKPLARPDRDELTAADLDRLAAGDVATVLGPRYDQQGANAALRTRADRSAALAAVRALGVRGHGAGRGGLLATPVGDVLDAPGLLAAAVEAVEVVALALGLHLVLPDATLEYRAGEPVVRDVDAIGAELACDVTAVDLVPRPHVTARVVLRRGDEVLGVVPDVTVTVRERPGTPIGPDAEGRAPFLGRVSPRGERVLLSEFHMTHMARGEPGIGHGPPFAHLADRRATRLPSGGLQLVDRVVSIDHGRRGALADAAYTTEYDAPGDAWYFADSVNADVPNVVLMETSLQSALLVGYYLGATLGDAGQDYVLRNLGGTATLRRELDLRDRTIRQHSRITATTPMSGSILQEFAYELTVDGEPYYDGESMFGFFTEAAMANQTGLDGGRSVPTWLERHDPPARRTLDVAARRDGSAAADTEWQQRHSADIPPARDHLALVDEITVVDGGGEHGQGYLHVSAPIDPGAWYFARHFHLDPVVPGSLGVEQVLQAVQEWALDAGLAAELDAPEFVVPVGVPLAWRYRGQVLPTDGVVTFEVHLTGVERRPGRIRVGATASLWKPGDAAQRSSTPRTGLRIYELEGVAVELRERGAPAWQ